MTHGENQNDPPYINYINMDLSMVNGMCVNTDSCMDMDHDPCSSILPMSEKVRKLSNIEDPELCYHTPIFSHMPDLRSENNETEKTQQMQILTGLVKNE